MTTKDKCAFAQGGIVRSKDTGKLYRVIREYAFTLMVTAADKKRSIPFTLPKTSFYPPIAD